MGSLQYIVSCNIALPVDVDMLFYSIYDNALNLFHSVRICKNT